MQIHDFYYDDGKTVHLVSVSYYACGTLADFRIPQQLLAAGEHMEAIMRKASAIHAKGT